MISLVVTLYFISLHQEMMSSLRIVGIVFVLLNFKIDALLFASLDHPANFGFFSLHLLLPVTITAAILNLQD